MAFLFKSKKNADKAQALRDGGNGVPASQSSLQSGNGRMPPQNEKPVTTPSSSVNNSITSLQGLGNPSTPSPEQINGRRGPSSEQAQDLPLRNGNAPPPQSMAPNPNSSLYPWSQRRITFTTNHPSPFPRYGAAVNSIASKEGEIYLMGGLINSSTVKGDLWMVEAGANMACYPLGTTAEGPGPRVGHASLLVGNAFIVYGGDTKMEDSDVLDETLYLLNTSTKQWSRAVPAGPRPSGRYGHSLNILESKIYVFGGQVEGYFMNDLVAFDLNQLQIPTNRWEMLIRNSDEGGPQPGQIPPARTNHSVVTYAGKLFLFGGTNGFQWFNDVWCYDPITNSWTMLDCIGYIPAPREGHAAAIVDDVMYIFGGRTEEGADLGDLAAFRISSRRWYTFQNMGPSPSPRSGHSMTAYGKQIIVLAGEPSTATREAQDLSIVYVLDTSKIRYPNDGQSQQTANDRAPGQRRPSGGEKSGLVGRMGSRDNSSLPEPKRLNGPPRDGPTSRGPGQPGMNGNDSNGVAPGSAQPQGPQPGSKLPRASLAQGQPGPPPQQQIPNPLRNGPGSVPPNKAKGPPGFQGPQGPQGPGKSDRIFGPAIDTAGIRSAQAENQSPAQRAFSPPPRDSPQSRDNPVTLLKELDAARNRNAWYASELELARKAGYTPNPSTSPMLDQKAAESFDDDDKPLIEALLAMKAELANVQSSIDKQAIIAAKQIAEVEKQRDAAVNEAVYAKAKLAAHTGSPSSTPQPDRESRDIEAMTMDRSTDISRKLAAALASQRDLKTKLDTLTAELEAEKRAKQLAEDIANTTQSRMAELETYKQQNSSEVELLKAELHELEIQAREGAIVCAEAVAAAQLIQAEKDELEAQHKEVMGATKDHSDTFESLREAITSTTDMKNLLERKLDEERSLRETIEGKLTSLKAEHEARTSELETVSRRLRDAEELAEQHAIEARTHKQAVMSGLDRVVASREIAPRDSARDDRASALEAQIAAANALARKYQAAADAASDKLRRAEERIAGLEAYQEQASREGMSIRKQLQAAMRETQSLQAANSDMKYQLANQQLETNAVHVQHNTLKDLLGERGISPSGSASRTRGLSSPHSGSNTPDMARLRELEQQLSASIQSHQETKEAFENREQEAESAYREKLSQLENDYQSAVHYVKGTEKMLKRMKDELSKYKTDNTRMKEQLASAEEKSASARSPSSWESERAGLTGQIESLQSEMKSSLTQMEQQITDLKNQLQATQHEHDNLKRSYDELEETLESNAEQARRELAQLQEENSLLEKRAQDAEEKVSLLLDQFESSVDTYRRQSRQPEATNGAPMPIHHQRSHSGQESISESSVYADNRNSMALDSLASELETLRTKWETTNKNYRLSNNFDFEDRPNTGNKSDTESKPELSGSLADWRKRLDAEEQEARSRKGSTGSVKVGGKSVSPSGEK
ncbi:Kelch-type beta propeller protein [Rutstroemia sp. NJR-2017a WRK4]|nr:Kelch-type beta propeller protein [Rutstroemia sp. NJR-2017a WRK4]